MTVTNSGSAPLSFSFDYRHRPLCSNQHLQCARGRQQASCTISVTYTPTAAGSALGAVTLMDNANNSPQVISLTGGGANFGLSIKPTSGTVVAGNPANVTVSVSSVSGFSLARHPGLRRLAGAGDLHGFTRHRYSQRYGRGNFNFDH